MDDLFFNHLAQALGVAPTVAAARGVLDLMQSSDPSPQRWQLPKAIQIASKRHDTPLMAALDSRGLLEEDFIADAVARWAAVHGNRPLLEAWLAHPQARAMAACDRGETVLSLIVREASKDDMPAAALARLLDPRLDWAQETLDRTLRLALHARQLGASPRGGVIQLLLGAGADPCYTPAGDDKPRSSALIMVHGHLRGQAHGEALIESLHRCVHWSKFVELGEKGKSMPFLMSSMLHCKALEEGLDKAPRNWWDGDPYGLLSLIVSRAHREPALLVAMTDRARLRGVEVGLPQALTPRIFMGLFNACGQENSKTQARADFWAGAAPRMACLWKQGQEWDDLCRLAQAFEASHGNTATSQERESFVQAAALISSTVPAQGQSRRRTL